MNFLNSCLWGLVPNDIFFTSGGNDLLNLETYASDPANPSLKTWVKESDDVVMEQPTLFLPLVATISVPELYNLIDLVDIAPDGYVTFEWKDQTVKGYLLKSGIRISDRGELKADLLLTADTDLSIFS
jgi:hypothetical protein